MATSAFDSFEAARALEAAGVERAQAEAIAEAIQQRQDYATKADIASLKADIAALETRMTNRLYVALGILFAALVAVGFFT